MLKVVALGNVLRGDDGVGHAVLDELKNSNPGPGVMLLDIGSDAFTLLEHFLQTDPIIIIDSARMGSLPGEVVKFPINQASLGQADKMISLHGFSLSEVYQMAHKLGEVPECHIIGIEPQTVEFNKELSPKIRNSIPLVIELVKEELKKNET